MRAANPWTAWQRAAWTGSSGSAAATRSATRRSTRPGSSRCSMELNELASACTSPIRPPLGAGFGHGRGVAVAGVGGEPVAPATCAAVHDSCQRRSGSDSPGRAWGMRRCAAAGSPPSQASSPARPSRRARSSADVPSSRGGLPAPAPRPDGRPARRSPPRPPPGPAATASSGPRAASARCQATAAASPPAATSASATAPCTARRSSGDSASRAAAWASGWRQTTRPPLDGQEPGPLRGGQVVVVQPAAMQGVGQDAGRCRAGDRGNASGARGHPPAASRGWPHRPRRVRSAAADRGVRRHRNAARRRAGRPSRAGPGGCPPTARVTDSATVRPRP